MSDYEYVAGKHKPPTAMIPCCDCFQIMNAIYSRAIRNTCDDCGGHALRDSNESLLMRRQARIDERRAAQNERLESA